MGVLMLEMLAGADPTPLNTALEMMRSALTLLDQGKAPEEIGAQLDLAICRLEATLQASITDAA